MKDMTAAELAQQVGAKRTGKGKWIVRCPVHGDHTPSLSIGVGKRQPIAIKCWSHQCSSADIMRAWGLSLRDLCGGDRQVDPAVREKVRDEERMRMLERRLSLVTVLLALEPHRRNYWLTAERRMRKELKELTFKLYPERKRVYDLQIRVRREGWDAMWKWLDTDKGKKSIKVHIALPHQPPHVHDKCVWDTDLGIIPVGGGGYLFCRQPGCLKLFEVERIFV